MSEKVMSKFLLKYGKLYPLNQSMFNTSRQDNNSFIEWNYLFLV